MVYYRWYENAPAMMRIFAPTVAPWMQDMMMKGFQTQVKGQLKGHGIGRHKKEEVYSIAHKDLLAVSNILGDKPFMMGEEPTLVDSTVFGLVAQFLWQDLDSPQHTMLRECTNLASHSERMKERYWPDWEETIALRIKYSHGK